MTTKTPFDPDDDDDAEDIVKVLKKTPPPPAPPPPILFVSFFSFFFGVASKTTAREIHIENALYTLSPRRVVTNSELTDALYSLCFSSAGRTPRRMGTWNRCAIRHR